MVPFTDGLRGASLRPHPPGADRISPLTLDPCRNPFPGPAPGTAFVVALLVAGLLAACGGGEPAAPEAEEPSGPPDQTYTVRGEVVALPDLERGAERQLRVRHEAIPDFVGFEGEVVGMASMVMPFPVAAGVDLEGLEAGDPVEMTFEVRWEGSPPLQVVELRRLPEGTELDFGNEEPLPGEGEVSEDGSQPP